MTNHSKAKTSNGNRAARKAFERELSDAVGEARSVVVNRMMTRAGELGAPATVGAFARALARAWHSAAYEIESDYPGARARG